MPNRIVASLADETATSVTQQAVAAAEHWWLGQAKRVLGEADAVKAPPPRMMWALAAAPTYKQGWENPKDPGRSKALACVRCAFNRPTCCVSFRDETRR